MTTASLVATVVGAAVFAVAVAIGQVRRSGAGASKAGAGLCGGCQRKMLPSWTRCLFCSWAPGARLEFIAGPLTGQKIQLAEEITTLGSVAGNTVILADPGVSKRHVGIRRVEGQFELADLGSTNGVYVNGQKLPKKILAGGDIIRVGNSEAVFKNV